MPRYDYRCSEHGDFEMQNRMADHDKGVCPTCGEPAKQVLLSAPSLDTEAMADIGMPGAFQKSGDRMTERHKKAGQYNNTPSKYWRD